MSEPHVLCPVPVAALSSEGLERGGWGDLCLVVCWPEPLVTVCLWSGQPVQPQEATPRWWLGLEGICNSVTKTNVSYGSGEWFYRRY